MRKTVFIMLLFCIVLFNEAYSQLNVKQRKDSIDMTYVLTPTKDSSSVTGYYIPKNLLDAYEELTHMISREVLDDIYHNRVSYLGLSFSIQNKLVEYWNLHGKSTIGSYFIDSLYITKSSDIVQMLMANLGNFLRNEPICVEKKVYLESQHKLGKNVFIHVDDNTFILENDAADRGLVCYTNDSLIIRLQFRAPSGGDRLFDFKLINKVKDTLLTVFKNKKIGLYADSLWAIASPLQKELNYGDSTFEAFFKNSPYYKMLKPEAKYYATYYLFFTEHDKKNTTNILLRNEYSPEFVENARKHKVFGLWVIRMNEKLCFQK